MVSEKDFEAIQGLEGSLEEETEPGRVVDDRVAVGDVGDNEDEDADLVADLSMEEEKELEEKKAKAEAAEVDE